MTLIHAEKSFGTTIYRCSLSSLKWQHSETQFKVDLQVNETPHFFYKLEDAILKFIKHCEWLQDNGHTINNTPDFKTIYDFFDPQKLRPIGYWKSSKYVTFEQFGFKYYMHYTICILEDTIY